MPGQRIARLDEQVALSIGHGDADHHAVEICCTLAPMAPAKKPTTIGNSGPSRKKMKALEKTTATKSRRATTQAA
jgi:hypothetical protein